MLCVNTFLLFFSKWRHMARQVLLLLSPSAIHTCKTASSSVAYIFLYKIVLDHCMEITLLVLGIIVIFGIIMGYKQEKAL